MFEHIVPLHFINALLEDSLFPTHDHWAYIFAMGQYISIYMQQLYVHDVVSYIFYNLRLLKSTFIRNNSKIIKNQDCSIHT